METGIPRTSQNASLMENSSPTCGSPIATSTWYCDSLRLVSTQVLIPAPVRIANFFFAFSEQRYAATQRVPLPEISASDPSALKSRARTSASGVGNSHSTPSAPTPSCRSQIRLLKPVISADRCMPSIIRKSLPQALALTKGTAVEDGVIRFLSVPAKLQLPAARTALGCGALPLAACGSPPDRTARERAAWWERPAHSS